MGWVGEKEKIVPPPAGQGLSLPTITIASGFNEVLLVGPDCFWHGDDQIVARSSVVEKEIPALRSIPVRVIWLLDIPTPGYSGRFCGQWPRNRAKVVLPPLSSPSHLCSLSHKRNEGK